MAFKDESLLAALVFCPSACALGFSPVDILAEVLNQTALGNHNLSSGPLHAHFLVPPMKLRTHFYCCVLPCCITAAIIFTPIRIPLEAEEWSAVFAGLQTLGIFWALIYASQGLHTWRAQSRHEVAANTNTAIVDWATSFATMVNNMTTETVTNYRLSYNALRSNLVRCAHTYGSDIIPLLTPVHDMDSEIRTMLGIRDGGHLDMTHPSTQIAIDQLRDKISSYTNKLTTYLMNNS